MTNIQLTKLDSGIRVITDQVSSVDSIAVGVWIDTGSRDETAVNNGAAHMVEHMLFKGTQNRDAKQIVNEIENVGGQMNAYTSRDITSYHMHLIADHAALAMDVLGDMVTRSILPDEEVERERDVILQEIGMTLDTPDDYVFDLYQQTAYPDQSFGQTILGSANHIQTMKREMLSDYIKDFYRPESLIISAAGKLDHDEICRLVDTSFSSIDNPSEPTDCMPAKYKGGDIREQKELEQTHIVFGFEGLSRTHEAYYNAQMLSAVLGGGMSSRLFQEVREKRGLAYSIYAYHMGYADTGQFGIYCGTAPNKTGELLHVLCDELQKATHDIKEEELTRAKNQMKSSLIMARESMMSRANGQAKYLLQRDSIFDQKKLIQKIESITPDSLFDTAKMMFNSVPTLTSYGDISNVPDYNDIIKRIS